MRRRILQMPSIGPTANIGNASLQPTTLTTGGTAWIVRVVKRNPIDVCTVSAVPTA